MNRKTIALGAGGTIETSILPYHLIRLAYQYDISVRVALTRGAQDFVTPLALESITGASVYTPEVRLDSASKEPIHLSLANLAVFVVYPATPRVIVECALGSITCPVTRIFSFAKKSKIIFAPFVHPDMDEKIYEPHLDSIQRLGVKVVRPRNGLVWYEESAWEMTQDAVVAALGGISPKPLPRLIGIASLNRDRKGP